MPLYNLVCPNEHKLNDYYHTVSAGHPKCPECGEQTVNFWQSPTNQEYGKPTNVIGDDIPGGVEIRHGICNEDGTPRVYYSKSEMRKEAARRGLVNRVEHVTRKDTDKSPHTSRWI